MISYWGVDHGDVISKAKEYTEYSPNHGFRKQGLAYNKKGARLRASKTNFKDQFSGSSLKMQTKHLAVGTAGGTGAGALVGGALGRGRGAKVGASVGGQLGFVGGAITGGNKAARHAGRRIVREGLESGDIVRRPRNEITAFGGTKKGYR